MEIQHVNILIYKRKVEHILGIRTYENVASNL